MSEMTVNLGQVNNPWTNGMAPRHLTADVKLTSHPVSANVLKSSNEGKSWGTGTNVKVSVAQESNTDTAIFHQGARMKYVEESVSLDRRLKAQLDQIRGEKVRYA